MGKPTLEIAYFYPRSPCGERLCTPHSASPWPMISIHALLAESDLWSAETARRFRYFYPRSPCGERPRQVFCFARQKNFYPRSPCGERLTALCRFDMHTRFLSTLSLRRATIEHLLTINDTSNFYPRSPCGERLMQTSKALHQGHFYPRSPCGERHPL